VHYRRDVALAVVRVGNGGSDHRVRLRCALEGAGGVSTLRREQHLLSAAGYGPWSRLTAYIALIADLRQRGLQCVLGGAALPNPARVSLHEKLGFKKVAEFQRVGFKFGRWIDVAYWQLMLTPVADRSFDPPSLHAP